MATYSPYLTGTVTATNGSPTVTGSGTTWTDINASAGSKIRIDGVEYVILTRDSGTQLTLTANYAGTTGSGKSYVVFWLKNPTNLTAGETVTLNGGIIVEITASAYSASGAGTVTVTNGKLLVKNTSTTSGINFNLNTNAVRINPSGLGVFETQGEFIPIATGNGGSGQTATLWSAEPCMALWIETGSGTGVFEKYLNLTGFLSTTNHPAITLVGAGDYGRFFTQSGTTVTFGDGTNGKCPPNGAIINQPNIAITYNGAYTTSTSQLQSTTAAGIFKLYKTQIGKHQLNFTNNNGSSAELVSASGINITQRSGKFYLTNCGFAPNGDAGSATEQPFRLTDAEGRIENCSAWAVGRTAGGIIQNSNGIMEWIDCDMFQVDIATASNAINFLFHNAASTNSYNYIRGGIWVGMWNVGGSCDIKNIAVASNPRLVEDKTNAGNHCFTFNNTSGSFFLDGITVPTGGGFRGNFLQMPSCETLDLRNITINSSYFTDIFGWIGTIVGEFNFININISGGRAGSRITPININARNITWQNVISGKYDWVGYSTNDQLNFGVFKKVPFDAAVGAGSKDISYFESLTGATTGVIKFFYQTTINDPFVSFGGTADAVKGTANGWAFPANGDFIEVEAPSKIFGISAFTAATATNNSEFATEYSLDTGSGWGAWTVLNTSNISAETVDKNTGFKLKVRTTAIADNVASQITGCSINVTQDPTVLYPTSNATITLTGLQSGSEVRIYNHATGAEIGGTENSGTTYSLTYDYFSDIVVDIVVHALGFQWTSIPYTLTAFDASIPIQQILDRQYNNP